jgi:hypothetical protein
VQLCQHPQERRARCNVRNQIHPVLTFAMPVYCTYLPGPQAREQCTQY